MIYITEEKEYLKRLNEGYSLLKVSCANGLFVDAWFNENKDEKTIQKQFGNLRLNLTSNGLFGSFESDVLSTETNIEEITKNAYLQIFEALKAYPQMQIIRFWNSVPEIHKSLLDGKILYHLFNAGRYHAFKTFFQKEFEGMSIPAASALGSEEKYLKIEFLAVSNYIAFIENKEQIPGYHYSKKYGKRPPLFSRGVIFNNKGQHILLSSGTASVVGEDSCHDNDIYEQLGESIQNLRILGSQFNLKKNDIHYGFAIEDIVLFRVYYRHEADRPLLERLVPKFLSPRCKLSFQKADICRKELLVEVEALFVKKGENENGNKNLKYFLDSEQRISTESFEIHVAEHCNLKCRDCCNVSPFNPKKFMSLEAVQDVCDFVKMHFKPDIFKIVGGEPTLHPQLDELLRLVKQSNVSHVIRVVTNGLLLHKMKAGFWENIDQLTVSNYSSAPVKQTFLDEVKVKAKEYGIVLNIKYVDQFNEIFLDEPIRDKDRIQKIYNDCWMRHRCLIIREGYFHKCTRASYMSSSLRGEDGIALDDPDFKAKSLKYLNCDVPLDSCQQCLGVSGNLRPNIQLKFKKNK
jgi:organic radical activating enzyme